MPAALDLRPLTGPIRLHLRANEPVRLRLMAGRSVCGFSASRVRKA